MRTHDYNSFISIYLPHGLCARTNLFLLIKMKSKSNIRIIDIARMANVSVGTVDRILHKRGHVSEDKRQRVEKILNEINYQPNMVARFLASNKTYTFATITPSYSAGSYWELACHGIEKAGNELNKFNVNIEPVFFDQYNRESFTKAAQVILNAEFDGVVIATLFGELAIDLSRKLDELNIPYIYIDSNIPQQNNLAYFGGNSFISGKIAARLLLQQIGTDADIFFAHIKFKHKEISVQMKSREYGFMEYLNEIGYKGQINHIELDTDNKDECVQKLKNLLVSYNNSPAGGIVLNSRVYELVNLFKNIDTKLTQNISLVGHDAIECNVQALKDGKISFLLSQRPDVQGYDAVKALANHLLFGQQYQKDNYMPIDILIKENIDYYNNYKL